MYKNPKTLFKGKRVDVLSVEIENKDGKILQRELVSHPGAVVILPIIENKIVLIRNVRYVVQKRLWELPAGTLEKNEIPIACAARELEEETGYRAGKITPLLQFYSRLNPH